EVQESADYAFAGKQILLAEDNEINAEIAVDILEEEGASVDVAGNGKIAVEMFENSPVNHYDLILMDVQMPERNGREAASDIRRLDRADAKTVLIFAFLRMPMWKTAAVPFLRHGRAFCKAGGFSEDEDRDRRNHPAEKAVSVSGFAQKACGGGKNEKSAETDSDRDRFADNYGFRHRYLSAVFGEFL
ncbi:MAG: response regulator, partial [Ruminococcus sp.]